MVTHMVKIYMEPLRGEAENAVNNWIVNHPQWEDDPLSQGLNPGWFGMDESTNPDFMVGDYRFEQSAERVTLLDDIENRLNNIQGKPTWFRIGYHVCDHDEVDTKGCKWDEVRENRRGKVPDQVPLFDTT